MVKGNEWYAPFDALARTESTAGFPGMILTPFTRDVLSVSFQDRLRAAGHAAATPRPVHPAAVDLIDPAGLFSVFAVIPWVFLIDLRKLGHRPVPCQWADLLDPVYHDQIVFGGWKRPSDGTYPDCNDFLLLNLYRRFGIAGYEPSPTIRGPSSITRSPRGSQAPTARRAARFPSCPGCRPIFARAATAPR